MPTTVIGPAEGMAWILAFLQADATLTTLLPDGANGIFRTVAPQSVINAGHIYILISYQGGAFVLGSFATRIMSSGLYQVVAVGPDTQHSSIITVARQLDADLQRQVNQSAQGATIISSVGEQPLELSEVLSGTDQLWTRIGGLYRVLVR